MVRGFLFIPVMALAMPCLGQWVTITEPPTAVFDVYALNADTVIVAADYGTIMRSTDGGDNWSTFQTPYVWEWFYDIDFPVPEIGYIVGGADFGEQCIAKTMDGGVTWDSLTSGELGSGTIGEVVFLNADTGFFMNGYTLRRTLDGGNTIVNVPLGPYVYCTAVAFADTSLGFFAVKHWIGGVAGEVNILRSNNVLNTWDTVYTDLVPDIQNASRAISHMQFVDAQNGFAVGANGTFLKTTDGGDTWAYSVIPAGSGLSDLQFTSPTTGWVANGGILRTEDGGATWEEQVQDTTESIWRLHMVDQNVGYAVAWEHIFKTGNGGGFTSIVEEKTGATLLLYPNPSSDRLTIEHSEQGPIVELSVVDVMGRVMPLKLTDGRLADLSALADGSYVVIARTTSALLRATIIISR